MRERAIKKQFWINQDEENLLKSKSKRAGLNESEFLRSLIKGYKIKEQPTKEIRDFIKQISGISNNINQIARMANAKKVIDVPHLKKEIDKLNKKKITLDPDNSSKEYTIELVKKLDCIEKNDNLIFTNIKNIGFAFLYDLLTRKAKRDLIHRLISQIEITRDKNYNIDIKNIKFTDELITKSNKEYIKYLNKIMENNNIGIKFYKEINKEKLKNIELDYDILSIKKMKLNKYSNEFLEYFISKSREHLYVDGIISCPYVEENKLKDILILVPKKDIAVTN